MGAELGSWLEPLAPLSGAGLGQWPPRGALSGPGSLALSSAFVFLEYSTPLPELAGPEGSPRKQKQEPLPLDFVAPVAVVSNICIYGTERVVACGSPMCVPVSHR